jgi:GTPase
MSSKNDMPLVAIVGKPNVGKSTIFNRMIGKRKAITDHMPGVTRDPLDSVCKINDKNIRLVDTGGVKNFTEGLDTAVSDKSIEMADAADLILLVFDAHDVSAEDEFFIDKMRRYQKKIIPVVNKVDDPKKEALSWDFYSYGFDEIICVSAAHGRNFEELRDRIEDRIDFDNFQPTTQLIDDTISFAILGKPNTGKSTLSNRLIGSEKSIISEIPGTTRDVIEGLFTYGDKKFRVLDTAGIRKKNRVHEDVEYYSVNRAIRSIDEADIIFLLIDSTEGLSDQDKKIASLIVNKGRGVVLVLNKWDLIEKIPNQLNAVTDRVRFLFPILDFAPLVSISALTGKGLEELFKQALRIWKELNTRIETARLNKHLSEWIELNPPPLYKRRPLKLRYITQIGTHPVKFILFVSRKRGFPESYIQYIRNKIRKEFAFMHIPLILELRER